MNWTTSRGCWWCGAYVQTRWPMPCRTSSLATWVRGLLNLRWVNPSSNTSPSHITSSFCLSLTYVDNSRRLTLALYSRTLPPPPPSSSSCPLGRTLLLRFTNLPKRCVSPRNCQPFPSVKDRWGQQLESIVKMSVCEIMPVFMACGAVLQSVLCICDSICILHSLRQSELWNMNLLSSEFFCWIWILLASRFRFIWLPLSSLQCTYLCIRALSYMRKGRLPGQLMLFCHTFRTNTRSAPSDPLIIFRMIPQ